MLFQRAATKQAHHQIGPVRFSPEVVQRHDVGMLQTGHQVRFRFETAHELDPVGQLGPDHLDRHAPTDRWLGATEHRRERALTELRSEHIAAHGGGGRGSAGDQIQRGVLGQDPRFKSLQFRTRPKAGVLGQSLAGNGDGAQRVSLSPGSVERQRVQRLDAFSSRLLLRHRPQVPERFMGAACRQKRRAPLLLGGDVELVELFDGADGPSLLRELCIRPAVPQQQRRVDVFDRTGVIPRRGAGSGGNHQLGESLGVKPTVANVQSVARRFGLQHLSGHPGLGECPAQT